MSTTCSSENLITNVNTIQLFKCFCFISRATINIPRSLLAPHNQAPTINTTATINIPRSLPASPWHDLFLRCPHFVQPTLDTATREHEDRRGAAMGRRGGAAQWMSPDEGGRAMASPIRPALLPT